MSGCRSAYVAVGLKKAQGDLWLSALRDHLGSSLQAVPGKRLLASLAGFPSS